VKGERISKQPTVAFYAPSAKRRFLTLKGAATAEAKARIYRMFPADPVCDCCSDKGWDIRWDAPEKYARLMNRLVKVLMRQFRAK
jgi:hypothetical protein